MNRPSHLRSPPRILPRPRLRFDPPRVADARPIDGMSRWQALGRDRESGTRVARWGDAGYSVVLYRTSYAS
jgi:hypothetical protein